MTLEKEQQHSKVFNIVATLLSRHHLSIILRTGGGRHSITSADSFNQKHHIVITLAAHLSEWTQDSRLQIVMHETAESNLRSYK